MGKTAPAMKAVAMRSSVASSDIWGDEDWTGAIENGQSILWEAHGFESERIALEAAKNEIDRRRGVGGHQLRKLLGIEAAARAYVDIVEKPLAGKSKRVLAAFKGLKRALGNPTVLKP